MSVTYPQRSVASLASYLNGYPFKPEDHSDQGVPVVRIRQLLDATSDVDYYQGTVPPNNQIDTGDLIFSWSGSLAVRTWDRGPAFLNQHLFKVVPLAGIQQGWLRWALEYATWLFEPYMHGSAMTHITKPMMRAVRIPTPPLDVQRRIADFLDDQVARIESIIQVRQQQTRLLDEWFSSYVVHATTVGLGTEEAVPSGLPWAPVVSGTRPLIPHKAILRLRQELVANEWQRFTLLSLTKKGVIPRNTDDNFGKFPAAFDTYQRVLPGNLVFCLFDVDETPRTVGLVESEGMVTGAYTRFEVDTDICDPSFLRWYFVGIDDRKAFRPLYTGMRKGIQKDRFLSAKMPLPTLRIQREISALLDDLSDERVRFMGDLGHQVSLLQDLKRSLITAAVSGEFDVSSADGSGVAM